MVISLSFVVKSKIGVLGSGGNFLVYSLFCPMRKLVKLASGSKFDKMKLIQLFPLFDLGIVRIWVEMHFLLVLLSAFCMLVRDIVIFSYQIV